jgi:mono/diheme cytochrome c family protein
MRAIPPGLALLFLGALARASDPRLYSAQCAPCHGATAHGEGPEAWLFSPPPPNLRIAALERHDPGVLVRRILDGMTGSVVPGPHALAASAARTDALVGYLERLPRVNWVLAERGRSLYLERCDRCHGAFGHPAPTPPEAGRPPPRDLAASTLPVDDEQLAVLIRHRREGMPALPEGLADGDVPALVAFLRLLSPSYETYEVSCARCHGEQGIPRRGGTQPTVVFDRDYFAAQPTASVRARVWHMLGEPKPEVMPHFGAVLTEAQARAIVDYLQVLPADR